MTQSLRAVRHNGVPRVNRVLRLVSSEERDVVVVGVLPACDCPYHRIVRGELPTVEDDLSDYQHHGLECLRDLTLASARAMLRQDWREATVIAQRCVFVSARLCREATANLVREEGLVLP